MLRSSNGGTGGGSLVTAPVGTIAQKTVPGTGRGCRGAGPTAGNDRSGGHGALRHDAVNEHSFIFHGTEGKVNPPQCVEA